MSYLPQTPNNVYRKISTLFPQYPETYTGSIIFPNTRPDMLRLQPIVWNSMPFNPGCCFDPQQKETVLKFLNKPCLWVLSNKLIVAIQQFSSIDEFHHCHLSTAAKNKAIAAGMLYPSEINPNEYTLNNVSGSYYGNVEDRSPNFTIRQLIGYALAVLEFTAAGLPSLLKSLGKQLKLEFNYKLGKKSGTLYLENIQPFADFLKMSPEKALNSEKLAFALKPYHKILEQIFKPEEVTSAEKPIPQVKL